MNDNDSIVVDIDEKQRSCESLMVVSYSYSYEKFDCKSLNMVNLKYILLGADCWNLGLKSLLITGL